MFYRQLAEVSAYVHDSSHELTEILQMLCIKALSPLRADALVYIELDHNGFTVPRSSFGIDLHDKSGEIPSFHLSERTPFTDSIRENKVVVINTLPLWPKPYAPLKKLDLPENFKSLISSPIENAGLPIGSLATFSHEKIEFETDLSEFIQALSIILAGALRNSQHREVGNSSNSQSREEYLPSLIKNEEDKTLSERQNLILKLISEGRTNAAIADVLGYSESLIRQETIKIYAKLNCSGRNEAAQAYHRLLSDEPSLAM
jgi:DNA-binding CsgD family transcriptional regulator